MAEHEVNALEYKALELHGCGEKGHVGQNVGGVVAGDDVEVAGTAVVTRTATGAEVDSFVATEGEDVVNDNVGLEEVGVSGQHTRP